MSTRESMRRELRELAKMAEAQRREQSNDLRSSGEWSYVDPASETPAVPTAAAIATPLEAVAPPRPSSVTVPPIAPSTPPLGVVDLDDVAPRRSSRSWMLIGAAAAVVLLGGAFAGRSMLGGHAADSAAAAVQAPAAPPAAGDRQSPSVLPSQEETMRALQALTPGVAPSASSPAPEPAAASTPSASKTRRARPVTTKAARPAAADAPAAAPAKAAAPSGPQSLDDLIRKAVSDPHSK